MKNLFINGKIVTPDQILDKGGLLTEGTRISAVLTEEEVLKTLEGISDIQVTDLNGAWLLPGFIDIHSDMIENLIQPRSTAWMDMDMALREAEKQLAACGITTIFHSIAMFREGSWDAREIRRAPSVRRLAGAVAKLEGMAHLIHNRFHLRYELDNLECYPLVGELIQEGKVHLLSLMDHRPCQGQYRDLKVYRRHLPSEGRNLSEEEFDELIKREQSKPMVNKKELEILAEMALCHGVPIASHDDDSPEKMRENEALKVSISEFPIDMDTAEEAKKRGIAALLGAPNILLGKSHSGNLGAEEALRNGYGDILCSDYYPQAMLKAVFQLYQKNIMPLFQAVRLVTLNPAKAAKMEQKTGSLEVGKQADLLVVAEEDHSPVLLQTWVSGCCVMKNQYHREGGAA